MLRRCLKRHPVRQSDLKEPTSTLNKWNTGSCNNARAGFWVKRLDVKRLGYLVYPSVDLGDRVINHCISGDTPLAPRYQQLDRSAAVNRLLLLVRGVDSNTLASTPVLLDADLG